MSTPTSKDSLESVVESNQDSDERTTVKAIENFLRDKFNTARMLRELCDSKCIDDFSSEKLSDHETTCTTACHDKFFEALQIITKAMQNVSM